MSTTTRKAAIAEVAGDLNSRGEYCPAVIYGYDDAAAAIAERCGIEADYCHTDRPATVRSLRRLARLCRRYGLDDEAARLDGIAERRIDERRGVVRFAHPSGDRLDIQANWADAASAIWYRWPDHDGPDGWHGTPFQVADARHQPAAACRLVARWLKS